MENELIELISKFLSNQPLYRPAILHENYLYATGVEGPFDFQGVTFSYYCAHEREVRTFELELQKSSIDFWGKQIGGVVPKEILDKGKLDFIHHFIGKCRSCKLFHVDFLLHVWSTKPIEADLLLQSRIGNRANSHPNESSEEANIIYIEKIGINPEVKPVLDKELIKYFDRETNNWYFKGKKSLNENFGIGAFAYFRRII